VPDDAAYVRGVSGPATTASPHWCVFAPSSHARPRDDDPLASGGDNDGELAIRDVGR
jgi:hypothetical protein